MQHILKTFENNTNSNLSILDFKVISLMDEANLSIIEQSDLGMQILKKMAFGFFLPKNCIHLGQCFNLKYNDELYKLGLKR